MSLTSPPRKVMQNMANVVPYKLISQNRISGAAVRISKEYLFQGNWSILSILAGCGYLTAICYRNIISIHIS